METSRKEITTARQTSKRNISKGEGKKQILKNKEKHAVRIGLPILAFTTPNGLVLDFDCYDVGEIVTICTRITEIYNCGDILIVYSNWRGQKTLDNHKAIHAHAIFGKVMKHSKVQIILSRLVTLHIVEELFRFFHQVELELTLRTTPKAIGDPLPRPFIYISIDGSNEVIHNYLSQLKEDKQIYKEVIDCLN